MEEKRKRDLEDEMSRFESEISSNLPPPPNLPRPPLPPRSFAPPRFNLSNLRPKLSGMPKMPFPIPPMLPHMFQALPPIDGLPPPPPMPPAMLGGPMMSIMPVSQSKGASSSLSTNKPSVTLPKRKINKKTARVAGGQVWEDNSLLDWDPNDFRIFVGDLGNEVSDDALLRAFSKYPSLLRAKIVRDKKTKKTKGYGFVSFKNPQDYLKAMREMNGKYVGNRPIKLRKSTWKDRGLTQAKKKEKEKKKLGIK